MNSLFIPVNCLFAMSYMITPLSHEVIRENLKREFFVIMNNNVIIIENQQKFGHIRISLN